MTILLPKCIEAFWYKNAVITVHEDDETPVPIEYQLPGHICCVVVAHTTTGNASVPGCMLNRDDLEKDARDVVTGYDLVSDARTRGA
jgi:hypothetical protein